MEKTRGIKTNCGDQLARPYVNNQTLTKMYNLCTALKYGSLFPEQRRRTDLRGRLLCR